MRPGHPTLCPSRHRLRYLTGRVAVCTGHPSNVWWVKRRGRNWIVEGVWNEAAVALARRLVRKGAVSK